MANFTEENNYPATVEKYELNTPVQGGEETAPSNAPLKKLVNRTNYLKIAYDALIAAYNAFVASIPTNYYNKTQTDSQISSAIANLVNSSPATLDTLGEIATALGNDPNLATTLTNLIGAKANSADVYTKSQVFAKSEQAGLATTVVDIGVWDMASTSVVDVVHGLDLTKIRQISVTIRNDANNALYELSKDPVNTKIDHVNSTHIRLTTGASSFFFNANFSATAYNRGWIVFRHLQ